MFTQTELDWVKALVETMRGKGYKYYVAQTVTENNNDIDVIVVFSKKSIGGDGLYRYTISEGVRYSLDSNGFSSYSGGGVRTTVDSFSGVLDISNTEFVYTNAEFSGSTIQPDLRTTGGGVTGESIQTGVFLLTLVLLVTVLFRVFRRS